MRIRRRTLRTHSCHFIPCLRGVVFLCHSLSYLYVPGAAARRGSGPMTAAGRRGPRLCAAHGSRAEVVTRHGPLAPRHPEGRAARSTRLNNNLYMCFCMFRVMLVYLYLPGAAAHRGSRPAVGSTPTEPHAPRAQSSQRLYCGVKTEGIARGFNPLVGCVRIHSSQRSLLSFRNYFRVAQPRPRRALPKRIAAHWSWLSAHARFGCTL